jgi:hypothetical protein
MFNTMTESRRRRRQNDHHPGERCSKPRSWKVLNRRRRRDAPIIAGGVDLFAFGFSELLFRRVFVVERFLALFAPLRELAFVV